MDLRIYSDLHLHAHNRMIIKDDSPGDVLILPGDIFSFPYYSYLQHLLQNWEKPVVFVPGNHEYYGSNPIDIALANFKDWASTHLPHMRVLDNEKCEIDGVSFFGGTMWTDLSQQTPDVLQKMRKEINDYTHILNTEDHWITPDNMTTRHRVFESSIKAWFNQEASGKRVVVSHFAPDNNPQNKYNGHYLRPAYASLNMQAVIDEYQPDVWIYGHDHQGDDHRRGKTRIASNPKGYTRKDGQPECPNFKPDGLLIRL
ncbi:MAG: metallophosphoesterase [Pseudomonadota bacterium]